MKDSIYAIYGASGYGREVMPLMRNMVKSGGLICFIDDGIDAKEINGYKVFSYKNFLAMDIANKYINVAIADSMIRKTLVDTCLSDGLKLFGVRADNIVIMDNVDLDAGSVLSPFVTLTSDIKIGKSFHANIYSYVAHDCIIGDYVTFAPSVKCNGNVVIEDHAYIGTGAILKQGTPEKPLIIGKGAIVGMGAVVTKNVLPNTVVVGNPAKPLIKTN